MMSFTEILNGVRIALIRKCDISSTYRMAKKNCNKLPQPGFGDKLRILFLPTCDDK